MLLTYPSGSNTTILSLQALVYPGKLKQKATISPGLSTAVTYFPLPSRLSLAGAGAQPSMRPAPCRLYKAGTGVSEFCHGLVDGKPKRYIKLPISLAQHTFAMCQALVYTSPPPISHCYGLITQEVISDKPLGMEDTTVAPWFR